MSAKKLFVERDHASSYVNYRPSYSSSGLIESMFKFLFRNNLPERLSLAVDVGCGQGQMINGLERYFDKIIGVDVSEAQILEAQKQNSHSNVQYIVCEAENLPLENDCVDVIVLGSALHWLDHSRFYKEVDRVLRPGGIIAATTVTQYFYVVDHARADELSDIINQMQDDMWSKGYYHKSHGYARNLYQDPELQIPFEETIRDCSLHITTSKTIDHLFKLVETYSGLVKYLNESEENRATWEKRKERFCEVYGSNDLNAPLKYENRLVTIMGRKPSSA